MEKVEIKVLNNVAKDAIRNYTLFDWKLIEQKEDLSETTLVFERDDQTPYYHEIVKLENDFNKVYSIPAIVPYIFIIITLFYVSIMTVLWLTHVLNIEKIVFVVILAIPTGILLLLNVFVTYLRTRQMTYHLTRKEEKYQKYQKKVNEIMGKN